ncbi:MAG TPA: CoA-binding protein [Hyphomicrobium sp.]
MKPKKPAPQKPVPKKPASQKQVLTNHDRYSDDTIADILREARVFAFVGASANTSRPSYFAMKYLLGKGYTVHPVNPGVAGQKILGQTVYGTLADVPAPVDVIDIFRASDAALEVTREAIALKDKLGLKVLWMQLGVRNDEAAAEAEAAGLKVIMNRCPKIEYGRLSGEIGWAGVNTGTISSVRPKLAALGVQSLSLGKR